MKHNFDNFTSHEIVGHYDEPNRKTPIIADMDVLVVGGSQSGVTAAIAAARNGAKVQIVERFGFLGGQSVYALVTQWEKRAFVNNLGAVLTKGIAKEMLDNIVAKGDSDGLWSDGKLGCPEMRDGEEWLIPEAITVTMYEMCEKAGIEILLHTIAVDVIVDRSGTLPRLTGVVFENKTGRFAIKAKVVIDATADLDLVWKAIGEEGCGMRGPEERIGAGFYVWYAGIDNEKYIEWYLTQANAQGGYPDPQLHPEKVRQHLKEEKLIYMSGAPFSDLMKKAEKMGLTDKIDDLMEALEAMILLSFSMKWVGRDKWNLHLTGLSALNMLDAWQLTKYEIFRQKLALYLLPILRLIPGWEKAYLVRESLYIGSRETRWLKAVKIINQDLIWDPENKTRPTPEDAIGRSGAHDPGKNRVWAGYPVPYGIIVPEKLDGVLVCARAVGTHPDRALDAHRGITPGMITGQGAGTAAAIAVKNGVQPRAVDLKSLQATLRKDGVQLDHESVQFDFEIPKDKIRNVSRPLEGTQKE